MTRPKRSYSETDAEDEAIAADAEAKLSGSRSYRHWRDRNEPPAPSSAVAMRQACPFPPRRDDDDDDSRRAAFFVGWQEAAGTLYDHEWRGNKFPERKGASCRVVSRKDRLWLVEFRDGERTTATSWWVRRKVA